MRVSNSLYRKEAAVPFHLTASAGPLLGRKYSFDGHDFFLLDRSKTMHSQLGDKEKYVSRIQFLVEINPPRGRVVDMGNPSGTFVNNKRVNAAELHHLDEIKAGHTYLRLRFREPPPRCRDWRPNRPLPRPIPGARHAAHSGIDSKANWATGRWRDVSGGARGR